jgi:hypothetical protein
MAAADADLVRWRLLGAISWQARFYIECRQRFVSLCSAAIKRLLCFRVSISLLSASQQSQVNPAAQRLTCYTRAGGSDTCGGAGVAAGDARAVAAAAPRPAAGGCAWSTFHRRSATIGRAAGRSAVGGMPGTSLRISCLQYIACTNTHMERTDHPWQSTIKQVEQNDRQLFQCACRICRTCQRHAWPRAIQV